MVATERRIVLEVGTHDLRRWGLRLAARGGKNPKKRPVVAVARKLATLLHRSGSVAPSISRCARPPESGGTTRPVDHRPSRRRSTA